MIFHRLFLTTVCLIFTFLLKAQDYSTDEALNDRILSILEPYKVVLDSQEVIGRWSKQYSSIEIKPNNKFKVGWSPGCWSPIISIRKGGKWSLVNDKLELRTKNNLDLMEVYFVSGSYFLVNSDINHDSWTEAKILSADILNQKSITDEELLRIVISCLLEKSSQLLKE